MVQLGELQTLHLPEHMMSQHVRQPHWTVFSLQENIYTY
jgi:hypothetical protein